MNNLVASSTIPNAQAINDLVTLAKILVPSGFLPNTINSVEKAVAIMLKGREVGIPPMQAFSDIAIINGKPALSAALMLALGYKNIPGLVVNFLSTTNELCVIEAKRPGGKATKFTFSIEDAKTAKLTGKGNWGTYPAAMLRARNISQVARAIFPDALAGMIYTPEELGAEVDEEGTVIDVPKEAKPEEAKPVEGKPINKERLLKAVEEVKPTKEDLLETLLSLVHQYGKTEDEFLNWVSRVNRRDIKKYEDLIETEIKSAIVALNQFISDREGKK